jgi:hypothetical protein
VEHIKGQLADWQERIEELEIEMQDLIEQINDGEINIKEDLLRIIEQTSDELTTMRWRLSFVEDDL